jgi:ribosome biogenesis GTPase / thiamine phosphate phosphatase
MKVRITKSTGSWYWAQDSNEKIYKCRLRGLFKNDNLKLTNPIAVGDWVNIEQEDTQNHNYLIDTIFDRENYLIRKSSRNKHNDHIIASNLDQIILFASLRSPRTSLGFIDRFLVSAEIYRIPTHIIFNKSDLYRKQDIEKYQILKAYYDHIGYFCHLCSVKNNHGIDAVVELLKTKTSLIAGHSGVGKSSVINAINPNLDLKTGDISAYNDKGTHVTTYAEMHKIFENSYIIDSPGIKEMAIANLEKQELKHQFPEMRQYLNQCKYDNCLHLEEPLCKVRDAINNNEIADWRYISYLSMLSDLE